MGFFSSIGNVFSTVSNLLDGGGVSDIIAPVVETGLNYLSSQRQIDANQRAADTVAAAEAERAAAIRAGNAAAQERFQSHIDLAAPANQQLRRLISADPSVLTPQQRKLLDDLRRTTKAHLAASGLRGAGRSVTAALRNVEGDFLSNAFDTNARRSDDAARLLSGQGASAVTNSAGIDRDSGRATGDAITTGAVNQAQADVVNENVRGQAIGDIASILDGILKEQGRGSRFAKKTPSEKDENESTL